MNSVSTCTMLGKSFIIPRGQNNILIIHKWRIQHLRQGLVKKIPDKRFQESKVLRPVFGKIMTMVDDADTGGGQTVNGQRQDRKSTRLNSSHGYNLVCR